jgi:lactate dehydrogenase-like 2-hydroxyacid dehydrogenase
MHDAIDAGFLDQCPTLQIIAGALKGSDNFDIEACRRRRLWFTVIRDELRLSAPTADLAVALVLEDWAIDGRPRQPHAELLAERDRTVFTPHLGSAVTSVRQGVDYEAAHNVLEALQGRKPPGALFDLLETQ